MNIGEIKKFQYGFEIRMDTELETVCRKTPGLSFDENGESCYFDPGKNEIHIGLEMIQSLFEPKTTEDWYAALDYVLGHEIEHKRSTSSRPYAIGIQKGCEEVLKYISSQVDTCTRRFRRPADYEAFAKDLENNGIYLSYSMITNIISGIANSLEDGRIERIRSDRMPGYENPRVRFRGIFWEKNTTGLKEVTNEVEKLQVITSNILTLATCQLYEKGFTKAFYGTDVMDEVNDLMPEIARAYIAPSCRAMSTEVINISKKLAPYIYEAAKMSAMDIRLKKMLEEMIKNMIEASLDNGDFGLLENDEMDGTMTSLPKGTFPLSDLEITLPDETYDRLMERAKETEDGNGIRVRREHPKEEEPEKEEKNDSRSGSGKESDKKADTSGENGSGGKSTENKKEDSDEKSEKGGGKSDAEDEGSKADGGKTDADGHKSEADDKNENTGATKDSDKGSTTGENESSAGGETSKGNPSGKGNANLNKDKDEVEDLIKKSMQEAAEKVHEEATEHIRNINVHRASVNKTGSSKKEKLDKTKPLSKEEIKQLIKRNFVEKKREYQVKDDLPSVIAARGRAMYRKNKRYFKSLSLPNVSHLESGSIDPSRIVALGYGDTDVFRKIGKDRSFDGCAYLLVDNSGSMAGNKRIEACKAAAVVEEGFREMFPVKIVAFDENGAIVHEVIKNWDEWLRKNCCWNFALHGRYGSGNEDGYDIQIATKELLERKEKNKMLIILSDGAPGDCELVKKAVRDARKKGIEVYSIYFEEGEVSEYGERTMKHMYEKDYLVCSLDELDKNLYSLFKKFSRK